MINKEKLARLKMMQTANNANIKDIIGSTVNVKAATETQYTDVEGEIHTVLSVDTDLGIYRTEVQNFIENFRLYWSVFEVLDDGEERPAIKITGKKSKRGNPYVGFEVVED